MNEKIKQHNRMVYSAQSQRHVVEQIDALYWSMVRKEDAAADEDAVVVKRDDDLTLTETILQLPEDYDGLHLNANAHNRVAETNEGAGGAEAAATATEYKRLREKLVELSRRRDEQRARLARYENLQTMLRPFENARETVQPNLVTRDGALAHELERMRILLAKVTGRLAADGEANSASRPVSSTATTSVDTNAPIPSPQQRLHDLMELT